MRKYHVYTKRHPFCKWFADTVLKGIPRLEPDVYVGPGIVRILESDPEAQAAVIPQGFKYKGNRICYLYGRLIRIDTSLDDLELAV